MLIQYLNIFASLAYNEGLSESGAIRAITEVPAEILGCGEKLGKIAERFDADFVIWKKHPLKHVLRPLQVYINGQCVYNQDDDISYDWEKYQSQPFS